MLDSAAAPALLFADDREDPHSSASGGGGGLSRIRSNLSMSTWMDILFCDCEDMACLLLKISAN